MKNIFLFLLVLSVLSFAILLVFFRESYLYDASIHLGMFSFAMYFLWKKDLKTTLAEVGFPGNVLKTLLFTIAGLAAIFIFLFLLGILAYIFGFNDQQKISEKVGSLPLYLLALAVIFAPITEELLFRALLVPRLGIIISSFLFGLLHLAYGSVVEVVGAIVIGFILAAIFRVSKSITPCIAIHFIYNLISIIMLRFLT